MEIPHTKILKSSSPEYLEAKPRDATPSHAKLTEGKNWEQKISKKILRANWAINIMEADQETAYTVSTRDQQNTTF